MYGHSAQKILPQLIFFYVDLFYLPFVELPEELVKGSERSCSLCGLFSGSRGPIPPSSRRVFLRLLLGFEKLPLAGFV